MVGAKKCTTNKIYDEGDPGGVGECSKKTTWKSNENECLHYCLENVLQKSAIMMMYGKWMRKFAFFPLFGIGTDFSLFSSIAKRTRKKWLKLIYSNEKRRNSHISIHFKLRFNYHIYTLI